MIRGYLIYLLVINFFTFIIYGEDKRRARRGAWRLQEKLLIGFSVLGGAVGGLMAMKIFRHKTRHTFFYVANYVAIFLHVSLLLLFKGA